MRPNRIFDPIEYATIDDEIHLFHHARASVLRIVGHEEVIVIDVKGMRSDLFDTTQRAGFGIYYGPFSDLRTFPSATKRRRFTPLLGRWRLRFYGWRESGQIRPTMCAN